MGVQDRKTITVSMLDTDKAFMFVTKDPRNIIMKTPYDLTLLSSKLSTGCPRAVGVYS